MAKQPIQKLNKFLGENELATLDDPNGFLAQFGFLVQDHDHYRSMLLACEPQKRQLMYDALRTRLSFTPKPLETYIAEGRAQADAEKLPAVGPEGKLIPYEDYSPNAKPLERLAQEAIARAEAERGAKKLWVVCLYCTAEQVFGGETKMDAIIKARAAGWVPTKEADEWKEMCPKCAADRSRIVITGGNA